MHAVTEPSPVWASRRPAWRSGYRAPATTATAPPAPRRGGVAGGAERTTVHGPGPAEVYVTLLGDGRYLCSERTFYRVLAEIAAVLEWRDQLRHPHYASPELLTTQPKQLWSWDIERHEALLNRVVMKGHHRRLVAASRPKLRAA